MRVLEVNIQDIALVIVFEPKGYAPISANVHAEGASALASINVKSARPSQVVNASSGMESIKDPQQTLMKFGSYFRGFSSAKDLAEALVREFLNRHNFLLPPHSCGRRLKKAGIVQSPILSSEVRSARLSSRFGVLGSEF
jgi:hypothetical protein